MFSLLSPSYWNRVRLPPIMPATICKQPFSRIIRKRLLPKPSGPLLMPCLPHRHTLHSLPL